MTAITLRLLQHFMGSLTDEVNEYGPITEERAESLTRAINEWRTGYTTYGKPPESVLAANATLPAGEVVNAAPVVKRRASRVRSR